MEKSPFKNFKDSKYCKQNLSLDNQILLRNILSDSITGPFIEHDISTFIISTQRLNSKTENETIDHLINFFIRDF